MRHLIIFSLGLLFLAASCDDDSFSQTVNIPIPEHDPLPALSLDLRSGDSIAYVRLALSRGILEDATASSLSAAIELYRDDILLAEFEAPLGTTDGATNAVPLPEVLTEEVATYRLVGTVAGFDPVEAIQEMPTVPDFTVISYEPDGGIDAGGYRVDEITLDIVDNGATADYYGFRVIVPQQNCTFDPVRDTVICEPNFEFVDDLYLDSPDPLLVMGEGYGLVLTDQSFNGATYRARIQADNYQDGPVRLEVFSLTEDAYRYAVSRRAYDDAGDNPFAEPVSIHNNVEGGYGFFVLGNRVGVDLE